MYDSVLTDHVDRPRKARARCVRNAPEKNLSHSTLSRTMLMFKRLPDYAPRHKRKSVDVIQLAFPERIDQAEAM